MKSRRLTSDMHAAGVIPGIDLTDSLKESLGKWVLSGFLLITTFSFAFFSTEAAIGVAAGGAISLLNFRDLKRTLESFFASMLSEGNRPGGFLVMRYYFKLTLIVIVLAALIKNGNIHIPGLIAGLSLVPAILIATSIVLYVKGLGGRL